MGKVIAAPDLLAWLCQKGLQPQDQRKVHGGHHDGAAGLALFVIAVASNFSGFLVGMAISGLGFGVYAAVDLALVVDVLPGKCSAAKDLGVFNIAGALPFSIAPAIAPAILAIDGRSYGVLYMVAGLCAIIGAAAILPVRRVR
jgi:MFS family permease